jgi:hypothetical protein
VTEYVVRRTGSPWEAEIMKDGEKIGQMYKGNDTNVRVSAIIGNNTAKFLLTPRIDGKVTPFSIAAYEQEKNLDQKNGREKIVFKIKNNVFWHNGRIYLLNSIPEGRLSRDHLSGSRFISRLVNFPFKNHEEIDLETWERLRRYRGIQVGEISGLGITGHKVKLESELEDIGIPLAAASYLIYSTG